MICLASSPDQTELILLGLRATSIRLDPNIDIAVEVACYVRLDLGQFENLKVIVAKSHHQNLFSDV